MEKCILTVDKLKKILDKLSASGHGDMKIKCKDVFLYDDEIGYLYYDQTLVFRKTLFRHQEVAKVMRLKYKIQEAIEAFYAEEDEE